MSEPANLRAEAFAGTAEAYRRYRRPYPRRLMDDMIARARIPADGRLLDLACGPGRVALALAEQFARIDAVDLEPEMIAVGQAAAERRGWTHVNWTIGRAEDFTAAPEAFDLITIGEAFHRLDQPRIAALALAWLKRGACLATLGGDGFLDGEAPWQRALRAVVVEQTRHAFPNGWATTTAGAGGVDQQEAVLRAAGFKDVVRRRFVEPVTWTVEGLVGYLRSMSITAPAIIGPDRAPFEQAVTEALLAHDSSGVYPQDDAFGYTLAWKP